MSLILDLFPVLLFFLAYQLGGIYWATASAIGASVAQIGWLLATKRRVEPVAWIGFGVITLFGGLTLWAHQHDVLGLNPTVFIRWKPTVLYWIFAAILFSGPLLFGTIPLRSLLSRQLDLPDHIWKRLNLAWAWFFLVLGALNLYVAFNYSEPAWVQFKVFGLMALMLLFVVAQGLLLARHAQDQHHDS